MARLTGEAWANGQLTRDVPLVEAHSRLVLGCGWEGREVDGLLRPSAMHIVGRWENTRWLPRMAFDRPSALCIPCQRSAACTADTHTERASM